MLVMQLFIIQLIIFIGLVIFLRNVLTKNVTRATSHLEKLTQDNLKKQEEINRALEKTKRDYNETIARAQQEANAIKEKATKEIEQLKEKTMEEARLESEEIIQKAERTKGLLIKEFEQKIEARAVERACELIQQVIPQNLQKQTHRHRVKELCQNRLEELERKYLVGEIKEVQIKSAFSLAPEERQTIKEILQKKIGTEFNLIEEVDPSLIAGLIINVGSLVIDGSIRFKIKEAAKIATQQSRE